MYMTVTPFSDTVPTRCTISLLIQSNACGRLVAVILTIAAPDAATPIYDLKSISVCFAHLLPNN